LGLRCAHRGGGEEQGRILHGAATTKDSNLGQAPRNKAITCNYNKADHENTTTFDVLALEPADFEVGPRGGHSASDEMHKPGNM
jgi:hypothetical protein